MHKWLFVFLLVALPAWGQQSSTGNLTAAGTVCASSTVCITLPLDQTKGGAGFTLSGTWSATVQFEGSADGGVTFQALNATPSNSTTAVTSATANGVWQANVAGFTHVRIRCSAFSSGPIVATINGSSASARTSGSGGGAVSSVFTRTGAVTAQLGDYTSATISGVTGSGAAPVMGFYLGPNCPVANTSQCYNTSANTQQDVTASWGTGSGAITITDSKFVAGDVGKRAYGYKTCNAFNNLMATNATSGAITTSAVVTITAFTDANHVTISANPANAVSLVTGQGGCFIWGTPDDTGAAALDTAAQASLSCPKIFLAAAYYMFTTPHFFTNPTSCIQAASVYQSPITVGNIYYSAGYEIEGRGRTNTTIYITPGFPETGTCTNGTSGAACFVQPVEGRWADFAISGGSNSQGVAGKNLIEANGPGSLDNINCYNWGPSATGTVGIYVTGWEQLRQVDNSGCGGIGINVANATGGTAPFGLQVRSENSSNETLQVNASTTFVCYMCGFYTSQFTGAAANNYAIAVVGTMRCYECDVQDGGVSTGATKSGVVVSAGGAYKQFCCDVSFGASGTGSSAIVQSGAGTVGLTNVSLSAGATGHTYADAAGAVLYDFGQNGGFTSGGGTSISGSVIGSLSSNGTVLTTAKLVLSAGWGSTAAVTVPKGGDAPVSFTITNSGTGQGATPTITYTFPTPYIIAPISCTATDLGGTNPLLNPFTTSSLTTTGAVFTATGTPTVSDTELMQITCVTP